MAHKGGLVISLNRKIGAAWLRSKSSPHHRDESQSGKSRRIRFSPVSQMEDQQGQFPAYSILALAFVRERVQGGIEGHSHRLQRVRTVKVMKSCRFAPMATQLLQIATVIDWDVR
jgi:hypothetical protein